MFGNSNTISTADYQFMQNNPALRLDPLSTNSFPQMQSTPATSVIPLQSHIYQAQQIYTNTASAHAPSTQMSSTHALLAHTSQQPSYTVASQLITVPSTQTPYTTHIYPPQHYPQHQYGFIDLNQFYVQQQLYIQQQQLQNMSYKQQEQYQQEQFYKQQLYAQKQLYKQQLDKQKQLKQHKYNLCLVKQKQLKPHKYNLYKYSNGKNFEFEFHSIYNNYNSYENNMNILLLRSDSLINKNYGQQLIQLIKPLQNNKFNYKNAQFVLAEREPKPKLQTIISQIQHYTQYKQLINEIPIGFTPTIFSLKQHKFLNEINGLLYKDNIELYNVIENVFIQFIPMFECLLDIKLSKYKQLSVIIKIQDFQFDNINKINCRWHAEGNINDNIIGVGIYYFDITNNNKLKFNENRLEIAEKEITNIAKINICNNDCIVFKNSEYMQHRAVISSINNTHVDRDIDRDTNKQMISRKMLTFFVMDPNNRNVSNHNANDFKFINFPWKLEIFLTHFIDYDMYFYNQIPTELISLIKIFTFGSEEYLQNEKVKYESNIEPRFIYTQSRDNPFGNSFYSLNSLYNLS